MISKKICNNFNIFVSEITTLTKFLNPWIISHNIIPEERRSEKIPCQTIQLLDTSEWRGGWGAGYEVRKGGGPPPSRVYCPARKSISRPKCIIYYKQPKGVISNFFFITRKLYVLNKSSSEAVFHTSFMIS